MNPTRRKRRLPNPIVLLLFRLPVWLYRLRLGWLLGRRFLMITHRGRTSGKIRQTVVEVTRYDRTNDEFIMVSGWGNTADWYRNIQANSALRVDVGGRRFTPDQRFLPPDEGSQELPGFERRSPRLFSFMLARLLGIQYDGSEEERGILVGQLPMVAFRRGQ